MKENHLINNRQIRVFISSTFQDMQDERDYLMKRTFPRLRKIASERDITLTECDLRWGITEEESRAGKVVEICLQEIENCIPFFIGIIGNRYGWVPGRNDLDDHVVERFKEVKRFLERHLSVTEMEIQFGVLQRKEDMHAFFYIREGEEAENEDNPEMLERLKKEVKASRYPTSYYNTTEDMAKQVEKDFVSLLDQLFPERNISELEKEHISQHSFMNQLCQNYIRDEKNFTVINKWMNDWNQHQLVIVGESGLGKSALIANWLKEKIQDKKRDYNIIYYFTGNGGGETSFEHLVKVLLETIIEIYKFDKRKTEDKKLEEIFKLVATNRKPLLIVLDAINQIVDIGDAKSLHWLPNSTNNIKILFSTLENDRTMEVFNERKVPIHILKPIDIDKRKEMVCSYLRLYSKSLSDCQITKIVNDPQCENTLVLKTLLDELIVFGDFKRLDTLIDDYLFPNSIESFYDVLLGNYEKEFGKDLVMKCLTLMSISHYGVTESEMVQICHLRPIDWIELFSALNSFLNTGNGLLFFSHTHFSNAVSKRYITADNNYIIPFRKAIIETVAEINPNRAIFEIPFQLLRLNEDNLLYEHVTKHLNELMFYDEGYAADYIERIIKSGLGNLKGFIVQEDNKVDFSHARFLFRHANIVRVSENQLDSVLDFIKPYLPYEYYFPSCVHDLAETYESLDIEKAIKIYRLEISLYSEGILRPLPGFLKEEEMLEIWHRIQELKEG